MRNAAVARLALLFQFFRLLSTHLVNRLAQLRRDAERIQNMNGMPRLFLAITFRQGFHMSLQIEVVSRIFRTFVWR